MSDNDITLRFVEANQAQPVSMDGLLLEKDLGFRTGEWFYQDVVEDPVTKAKKLVTKKFPVSLSLLDEAIASSNEMMAAGVKVPMPPDHDVQHSERNMGFGLRFVRKPDPKRPGEFRAAAIVEAASQEDKKTLIDKIRMVSVHFKRKFTDDYGRVWKNVFRHIAPTTHPAMHEQDNFVALQAQEDPTVRTVTLGGKDMDELMKLLQDYPGCAERAGVKLDDLAAENAIDKLKKILAWMAGQTFTAVEGRDAMMQDLQSRLDASKTEVTALKAKYEPPAHQPTPEELRLKDQNAELERELRERSVKDVEKELDLMFKGDHKLPAVAVPLARVLLMDEDAGDVTFKDKQGDKEVDLTLSRPEVFRRIMAAFPKGAALATGKPPKDAKPEEQPAEGNLELRDKQAKLAKEIQLRDKCTLAEAQLKAEVELKDKQ